MKKVPTASIPLKAESFPTNYIPTNAQVNTLAKLLIPEIKKFFADEKTQKEFSEWKEKQTAA